MQTNGGDRDNGYSVHSRTRVFRFVLELWGQFGLICWLMSWLNKW